MNSWSQVTENVRSTSNVEPTPWQSFIEYSGLVGTVASILGLLISIIAWWGVRSLGRTYTRRIELERLLKRVRNISQTLQTQWKNKAFEDADLLLHTCLALLESVRGLVDKEKRPGIDPVKTALTTYLERSGQADPGPLLLDACGKLGQIVVLIEGEIQLHKWGSK